MQTENNENSEFYEEYFNKVMFFNFMAKDIINFAAQKYGKEFFDYIDLNCGAVPEGEYEKIIDPSAPLQFLELYAGIVLKRIELTAQKILELGKGFDKVLENYFFNEAQKLEAKKPENISEAFGIFKAYVLEPLSAKDEVSKNTPEELCWKKSDGRNSIYWTMLVPAFVKGIFKDSAFVFSVSDSNECCIKKQ